MVPASDESPRPHAIPLHDSPTSAMVNYIRAPPRVRERAVYYCRSSGVGSRETPTIRTNKATRRRSTTMSAKSAKQRSCPRLLVHTMTLTMTI